MASVSSGSPHWRAARHRWHSRARLEYETHAIDSHHRTAKGPHRRDPERRIVFAEALELE